MTTTRPRSTLLLLPCLLLGCSHAPAPRAAAVQAIGVVQGAAARSAQVGQTVTIEGVVTAVFAGADGGWFVQDGGDGNVATSDALFVADAGNATGVAVGEQVRVRGVVAEQALRGDSRTTLLQPQVQRLVDGTAPTPLALTGAPPDWERYEGMTLRIAAPLRLADSSDLAHHGRVRTSLDGPLWQPSERAVPGSDAARALSVDNARRQLWLDGGRTASAWPPGLADARSGSTLTDAVGVLDAGDAGPRLRLTAASTLQAAPRPQPPHVAGDVRIAALNLENLFNGDGHGGGFPTPRGARTPAELTAQLDKHVATLRGLDADVIALMELENDGYGTDSSLAALVAALNAGGGDWHYVGACPEPCRSALHGPGDNAIRVGLIYRAGRVRPQASPAVLEGGPFGPHSRVPLAQAFVPVRNGRTDGAAFVVVANHFKSKGCSGAEDGDRDQGDGAGCWNATRTDSAQRLDTWLRSDPTRSGSQLTLIVGDFNAYAQEQPLQVLTAAGWRDALAVAGAEAPYSYVYDGRLGRLDHALLSPALAARLRGAAEWHSNADEPEGAGYRAGGAGPWRSSDHDPLLLGFALRGHR